MDINIDLLNSMEDISPSEIEEIICKTEKDYNVVVNAYAVKWTTVIKIPESPKTFVSGLLLECTHKPQQPKHLINNN